MQSSRTLFLGIIGLSLVVVGVMFGIKLRMPPPAPIAISVLYSTEKADWLKDVSGEFNGEVNGRRIEVTMKSMGSGEIYQNILEGKEQPDLISPAGLLQISMLENKSPNKFGKPLVKANDQNACRSVLNTPLVIVAWRERAQALWGDNPDGNMWKRLHDALVDPKGWAAHGHPEWGYVKFGHTDPLKSNSGFMTILLMTYNYLGKTAGLTSADLLSHPAYQQWLKEVEGTISEFGDSTGTYMKDMVSFGPSKYDMVAVYEATAIEQAENAVGRYGELRVYYPPATVLSDHPFCVLKDAPWVTPEKAQAAQVFVDYLLSKPVQEKALFSYGFRPTDKTIPLDQTGSPLNRYATNGLKVALPPEVELPPGDVLQTLLDFWLRNVKK